MRIASRFLLIILTLCLISCKGNSSDSQEMKENPLMSYWDSQHKGANQFNRHPSENWFKSAAEANIKLVRLTYGKWESAHRDFLLGDADNYKGLVEEDFLKLKESLDWADSYGIKIVLTPLSLPGARWRQNNDNIQDGKIWKDENYLNLARKFWIDLATRLNHHPAIVGYNLKNEPHPEIFYGYEDANDPGFHLWYDSIQGTPADLNYYNQELTNAIRSVDKTTPVIIESGLWANAKTYNYLKPVDDPFVIYSFHFYDPYAFTSFRINMNRHPYPGEMPFSPWSAEIITLDKAWLETFVQPVKEWSERNNIPPNRIFAGEFGCSRKITGAEKYLGDLISIFNTNKWHWAFYSYREDVWDSMDYELGDGKPGQEYWDHSGKESFPENYEKIYRDRESLIWKVIMKEFQVDSGDLGGNPQTYQECKSGKLEYGFFAPPEAMKGKSYPLVIFLHGWSQNMAVHLDEYEEDFQAKHPCFVYTPRTPVDWGDWSGWSESLSEPMQVAVHVLDSLLEIYPIDTCRLYVYGISMGGEGAFDLLHKFPGRFAAAMSVCGGGKPEWAKNISMTPFWMFHGSDDDVNPVTLTRDVVDVLEKMDAKEYRYTEYQGCGHDIWNRAPQEPDWQDWMFRFNRCED